MRTVIYPGDGDPRHGTAGGYQHNRCRCEDCTAANAAHVAAWRALRAAMGAAA